MALPSFPFTRQNLDVWLGKESLAIHIQKYYITLKLKSWIIWELRVDSQLPPNHSLWTKLGGYMFFLTNQQQEKTRFSSLNKWILYKSWKNRPLNSPGLLAGFTWRPGLGWKTPAAVRRRKKQKNNNQGQMQANDIYLFR